MLRLFRFLLRLVFLAVVLFILLVGWIVYDGSKDGGATTDCAVVMGAPLQSDGQPGSVLQARLDRAAALYKAQKFPAIILAGGSDGTTDGAAVVLAMVNYLVKQQVPASAMLQDPGGTSVDTAAHDVAVYVQQQNVQSVMVITHYYDVTRMKIALKREGVPQITQEHVGTVSAQDIMLAVTSAAQLVDRYAKHDAIPQSQKLIAQLKGGATSLKEKVIAQASGEPAATGSMIEAKGVANFNAPAGWAVRNEVPGSPYPAAAETATGPLDAYLMLAKSGNTDSIDTFVAIGITAEGRRLLTMDSEKADDFTTYAGVVGRRASGTRTIGGVNFDVVEYFFNAPAGGKVMVVGMCLANEADRMKPLFDASVRTVKLE